MMSYCTFIGEVHDRTTVFSAPKQGSNNFDYLQQFSQQVEVILLTSYQEEATSFLGPPNENFLGPVKFRENENWIVGMFADKKAALILTDEKSTTSLAEIVKFFPQFVCVIIIGTCPPFSEKHKPGHVLVFEEIYFTESDRFIVNRLLRGVFCGNLEAHSEVHFVSLPETNESLKFPSYLCEKQSQVRQKCIVIEGVFDGNSQAVAVAVQASLQFARSKLLCVPNLSNTGKWALCFNHVGLHRATLFPTLFHPIIDA